MSCFHGVGFFASMAEQTADHAQYGQSSTNIVIIRWLNHHLELREVP